MQYMCETVNIVQVLHILLIQKKKIILCKIG